MKLAPIAILAAVACVSAVGQAATPVLSVDTTTPVSVGDTVVVNVAVTDVSDLFAFQFDLGFDPTLLSFTGTSNEGSFLSSGGTTSFVAGIDTGSGVIANTADSLIGTISGVSGTGTLATFDFTAIAAGASLLTLDNVFLLDSNINPITFTTSTGAVTVVPAATVPEPGMLLLVGLAAVIATGFTRSRRTS